MTVDGPARLTIANELVRLHSEYYGRGPTKARVYADGPLLAVVLEETFTPAERTLIARGEADGIQDIRRRFQRVMKDQFVSVIEQATGRRVRAFLSETNLDEDLAVEMFILADERTDMSTFEEAGNEEEELPPDAPTT
jgi:uncharacterized protein YbcI